MRLKYFAAVLAVVLAGFAGREWMEASASAATEAKHAFTPDSVPYGPAPNFVEPGAQLAVLEGNPMAASGDYTIRLKLPAGYKIAPHWHPKRENVTVIAER
ncbi:MAG: hypothetical protein NVS9B14_22500 [Candidatus Acidiferrum sp.]